MSVSVSTQPASLAVWLRGHEGKSSDVHDHKTAIEKLPLLHRMEERAGERRNVLRGCPSVFSPLLRRGERKKKRRLQKICFMKHLMDRNSIPTVLVMTGGIALLLAMLPTLFGRQLIYSGVAANRLLIP